MKKLVLKNSLSYSKRGVKYVRGVPVSVADDVAEDLMATGQFEKVPENAPENGEPDFENMKAEELTKYADLHGIDLKGCKTNKDRIKKIKEVLESQKEGGNGEPDSDKDDPLKGFTQMDSGGSEV